MRKSPPTIIKPFQEINMNRDLKPSMLTMHPFKSITKKCEAETVAQNIMVILKRTGDVFRTLTWEEYKEERLKDGHFSEAEHEYFDEVIEFSKTANVAILFSPTWRNVADAI